MELTQHVFFCADFDECEGSPCQNGGRCVDHYQEFECICRDGFSGDRCQFGEEDIDDNYKVIGCGSGFHCTVK